MLLDSSASSRPWLLPLPLVLFVPMLAAILWLLSVYAIGKCFRGEDPRRLKLAIALMIVAAILPIASIVLEWSPRVDLIPLQNLLSFGGVGVMFAAATFGFVYVLPQSRAAPQGSAERERFDGLRELCLAAVFGGFAIGIVGNALNAYPRNLPLNLGLVVLFVLQCGFWMGRASLHLQRPIDDATSRRGEALER
jgi:hypothetical protein